MLDLAFAMAPSPDGADGGGGLLSLLPPMIMMFAIFYFILIRPQQKKQKETRRMLDDLTEGDTVVTLSGIHGTIKKIKDEIVMLQIADNCRIKINRSSIAIMKTEGTDTSRERKLDQKNEDEEIKKFCKVLGVNENISKNQLKKAYKKIASEVHPDKNLQNKKAEEEFKKVEEAYKFLLKNIK